MLFLPEAQAKAMGHRPEDQRRLCGTLWPLPKAVSYAVSHALQEQHLLALMLVNAYETDSLLPMQH